MSKIKSVIALALAGCMALTVLAGCGSSASSTGAQSAASGEKVVKIGVFEPQTGENGGGGFQEVLGIRYANKVYPTVKIGGEEYKVELVEVDNKSDKTEAVTAASYLVSQGVSVVLGSYGSGVSIAAGDIFASAKIPAIGCSCTNPQVTQGNDYYFRVCFLDPFQGTVMANYASDHSAKTAAVITQLGDDYSVGLGEYFKNAFTELGGEIVSDQQFQTNESDFNAILAGVKAANPDVIFAPSSITTAPLIIKQARAMGITADIMAGDTWENATIIENAGADADGILLSTFFDDADPATEEAKSFIEGFKPYLVENKQDDIIPAVSALGYDAYLTALKALEAAGSTDGEALIAAMATLNISGVTGEFGFDENGDATKDMAVVKTVENGEFKFLENVYVKDVQ